MRAYVYGIVVSAKVKLTLWWGAMVLCSAPRVTVIWCRAATVWCPDALLGRPCNVVRCCVVGSVAAVLFRARAASWALRRWRWDVVWGAAAVVRWPGLCLGGPARAPRLGAGGALLALESKRRLVRE